MAKTWNGTTLEKCDVCHGLLPAIFIDGKTKIGPWGILCPKCHLNIGVGLGTGRGQKYELNNNTKKWEKICG